MTTNESIRSSKVIYHLDVYDDVWKQVEHDEYPEQRMKHLLTITSNAFVQSVQKQLSNIDLWSDSKESIKTREQLRNGVNICERWSIAVEQLTTIYWRSYTPHPWKSEPFKATYLIQFKTRLNQIISIRSSYEQSLRFNPSANKENFSASKVFSPFFNLNPIQFNPYTDPQWNSAMDQFENLMSNTDREVARQLGEHFQKLRSNPQQMLVEFKRYVDLIQRDTIRKELATERELLLSHLESDLKNLTDDFSNLTSGGKKSSTKGMNRTAIAAALDTSRQMESKVKEKISFEEIYNLFFVLFKVNHIINDGGKLLGDLPGYSRVATLAKQLKQDLVNWRKDKFKEWCQETARAIDDPSQALRFDL